jgi:hypothetical protein
MSVIRAKAFGTFEFRSACSMPNVDELLEVAAFRVAQLLYGTAHRKSCIRGPASWQRGAALAVARAARPEDRLMDAMKISLKQFADTISAMPPPWRCHMPRMPQDVESIFSRVSEAKHA